MSEAEEAVTPEGAPSVKELKTALFGPPKLIAKAPNPQVVDENKEFDKLFAFLTKVEPGEDANDLKSYLARNDQDPRTKDAWLYVERATTLPDGTPGEPEIVGAINANVFTRKSSEEVFDAKVMVNYLLTDNTLDQAQKLEVEQALQAQLSEYTKGVIAASMPEGIAAPEVPKILTAVEAPSPLARTPEELVAYEESKGESTIDTLNRRVQSGLRELAIPFREPAFDANPEEKGNDKLGLWVKVEGVENAAQPSLPAKEVTALLQDWTDRAFPEGVKFDTHPSAKVTRDFLSLSEDSQVETFGVGRYTQIADLVTGDTLSKLASDESKKATRVGELFTGTPKILYGNEPVMLAVSTDIYPTAAIAEESRWTQLALKRQQQQSSGKTAGAGHAA